MQKKSLLVPQSYCTEQYFRISSLQSVTQKSTLFFSFVKLLVTIAQVSA